MRIAVIFDNFGPYHIARLSAAAGRCDLLGIEVAASSADYAWHPASRVVGFQKRVLLPESTRIGINRHVLAPRLNDVLASFRPEVVAIPGWSFLEAVLALRWSMENRVPAVLMSESQSIDESRNPIKEWTKSRFLGLCPSALVGGRTHREYLMRLGMIADRIFLGYDAVDNDYFARSTDSARANANELRRKLRLPQHYFLASNRFIPKKNLAFLLRAFARYRSTCPTVPWDLVLLGDGPLRSELESLAVALDIDRSVYFPGFKQYEELPVYYGLAGAFVHASSTEQWGLVVNEAMASGLPVLVSSRCGSACELVQDGENGFQFDPFHEADLVGFLLRISQCNKTCESMGEASRERISHWGPERFAIGLQAAAEYAVRSEPPVGQWIDRLLLAFLSRLRT
jgi:1,2-diacylglycerol 3-alpha-glucosyltransferase